MLIDFDATLNLSLEADTIIVGAGAVGLAIAVALARGGHTVTVLEAGGAAITAESQSYFSNAKYGALPLSGLRLGRFRALGGTTNLWGGQLVEFDETVFNERPWLGYAAWPFTKSEIKPFYSKAYRLLGLDEPLDRDAIWQRLHIDPNLPRDIIEDFFSAWLPEPNFTRLFQREIRTNPILRIVVNAPVVSFDSDPTGKRILSLSVRDKKGMLYSCKGQRVILANGTIEMARLLKLPLSDQREAIWAANPWLGKGFTDHIDCKIGSVRPLDKKRFHALFDNTFLDGIKYSPKLRLASSLQRQHQLHDASAYFLFDSRYADHIANAKILAHALFRGGISGTSSFKPQKLIAIIPLVIPMVSRYLRHRRMYNPTDLGIQLRMTCEQQVLKTSALSLLDHTDALGMPIVKLDWTLDGGEIETMAVFAEHLKRVFEASQLAHVSIDPKLMERDQAFLETVEDSKHHMGMARLGHSPEDGVVDRDLRVFGADNLYAVGAALFPTTGFANPTFTAIALGLRLVDHLTGSKTN